MHRTLSRQLRRLWGVGNPGELARLLARAREAAGDTALDPQLRVVLQTLDGLLDKVNASYEQAERDLHLRSRSLELSSQELIDGNMRLADELARRNRAFDAMKALVPPMAPPAGSEPDDLETLSRSISALV